MWWFNLLCGRNVAFQHPEIVFSLFGQTALMTLRWGRQFPHQGALTKKNCIFPVFDQSIRKLSGCIAHSRPL
ncbi:hypothetical protein Dda3937_04405 [Dickeya dadantii 3937]|uniref:Uncharacterized protein n=1 Tax=Dickeya dadantii (strain 3937) TaxID=198628 RepID=E0SH21_DICD3|nr:hypothetical protein Dda3937_04405 [Dickeya dadantii 3937]